MNISYDGHNRLTAYGNYRYEFDGNGHRVKQQISGYSNAVYYLWSSVLGEPVVEIDSTTPSVFRAYVYGPGGQMLAEQSYDGGFYWLHTDNLGNGRKMTNTSGTVIYRAEYDPHGQMLYEWQTSGATYLNSHKFTGYERDWSTNLDNAKARTFNHNKGRFMQPDPLGLGAADATNPQSLNLYSYVQNDPMNFVDPSGLNAQYPTVVGDFSVTISGQSSFEIWVIWQSIFGGPSSGSSGSSGDGSGWGGDGAQQPPIREMRATPPLTPEQEKRKKWQECMNSAHSEYSGTIKELTKRYDGKLGPTSSAAFEDNGWSFGIGAVVELVAKRAFSLSWGIAGYGISVAGSAAGGWRRDGKAYLNETATINEKYQKAVNECAKSLGL